MRKWHEEQIYKKNYTQLISFIKHAVYLTQKNGINSFKYRLKTIEQTNKQTKNHVWISFFLSPPLTRVQLKKIIANVLCGGVFYFSLSLFVKGISYFQHFQQI